MNKIKGLHKYFLAAIFIGAAMSAAIFTLSEYLLTASGQAGFTVENNTDRPGGDYKDFDLSRASYQMCQSACAGDSNCQAYTYVNPGVQGKSARCWLKNTVPAAGGSSRCISGVKKDEAAKGSFAGDWYAGERGNITFSQNGNRVSDAYTRGSGAIYGNASGNRLNAVWRQKGKEGVAYFNVLADETIEGKYCDGKNYNPENKTYFSGRKR